MEVDLVAAGDPKQQVRIAPANQNRAALLRRRATCDRVSGRDRITTKVCGPDVSAIEDDTKWTLAGAESRNDRASGLQPHHRILAAVGYPDRVPIEADSGRVVTHDESTQQGAI